MTTNRKTAASSKTKQKMDVAKLRRSVLPSARDDLKAHNPVDLYSGPESAYSFAFADEDFLLRRETRGIRLQLELLKPDMVQRELGIESTVVVFGSARFPDMQTALARKAKAKTAEEKKQAKIDVSNAHHYEEARRFGQLVAEYSASCEPDQRLVICTGGGPGIMEAANRGAFESGAMTVGLNIALPHEQYPNPYITPELCFQFHYFAIRKMHFLMRAKALVAFPGGYGTLDELFETLTLIQTGKAKPVPIILFCRAFWEKLLNFDMLLEEGVISPEDLRLFRFVDTADAAWEKLKEFYQLDGGAELLQD